PFQESTLRFGDVCVSVCVFVCVFVCVCVCVCVRECVVRLAVFAVSLLQPKGQHHTLSLSACRLCRTNPVRLLSLLPSLSYPAHTLSLSVCARVCVCVCVSLSLSLCVCVC